jgi:hypothetical protein
MYTIKDVYEMPISYLISYVRSHYPAEVHFQATEVQLRYMTVYFLDREGLLASHDSRIFHETYFGQLYAVSGGDTLLTTARFFFNLVPGVDYLSYF